MPPQDDQKKNNGEWIPEGAVLDQDRDYPEAGPPGSPRVPPRQEETTWMDTARRSYHYVVDPVTNAMRAWAAKDLPPPRLPEGQQAQPGAEPLVPTKAPPTTAPAKPTPQKPAGKSLRDTLENAYMGPPLTEEEQQKWYGFTPRAIRRSAGEAILGAPRAAWDLLTTSPTDIYNQGKELQRKSMEAHRAGRDTEAGGYAAASGLPVIGPMAAQIGEELGKKHVGQTLTNLGVQGALLGGAAEAALPELGGRELPRTRTTAQLPRPDARTHVDEVGERSPTRRPPGPERPATGGEPMGPIPPDTEHPRGPVFGPRRPPGMGPFGPSSATPRSTEIASPGAPGRENLGVSDRSETIPRLSLDEILRRATGQTPKEEP